MKNQNPGRLNAAAWSDPPGSSGTNGGGRASCGGEGKCKHSGLVSGWGQQVQVQVWTFCGFLKNFEKNLWKIIKMRKLKHKVQEILFGSTNLFKFLNKFHLWSSNNKFEPKTLKNHESAWNKPESSSSTFRNEIMPEILNKSYSQSSSSILI